MQSYHEFLITFLSFTWKNSIRFIEEIVNLATAAIHPKSIKFKNHNALCSKSVYCALWESIKSAFKASAYRSLIPHRRGHYLGQCAAVKAKNFTILNQPHLPGSKSVEIRRPRAHVGAAPACRAHLYDAAPTCRACTHGNAPTCRASPYGAAPTCIGSSQGAAPTCRASSYGAAPALSGTFVGAHKVPRWPAAREPPPPPLTPGVFTSFMRFKNGRQVRS